MDWFDKTADRDGQQFENKFIFLLVLERFVLPIDPDFLCISYV